MSGEISIYTIYTLKNKVTKPVSLPFVLPNNKL